MCALCMCIRACVAECSGLWCAWCQGRLILGPPDECPRCLAPAETPRVPRPQPRLVQRAATPARGNLSTDSSDKSSMDSAILASKPDVSWDDVIGMDAVKQALQEAVVLPTMRADLFQGIRAPVRGILLYGPPGNGKTLIAKAVAAATAATFFAVSAATVTSQWFGGSEKLMRELFQAARRHQPAVVFIDEIDALLGSRSASEHDAARRLKTEFLVQFDGVATGDERVLVLAATNRPQDLDDAVVRRLPRRIFVPLPEASARVAMIKHMLKGVRCVLSGAGLRLTSEVG
jgi:spastin